MYCIMCLDLQRNTQRYLPLSLQYPCVLYPSTMRAAKHLGLTIMVPLHQFVALGSGVLIFYLLVYTYTYEYQCLIIEMSGYYISSMVQRAPDFIFNTCIKPDNWIYENMENNALQRMS
ncbi:hypothetical protein K501DRAFT_265667 [Backusella circina FSU 941]|nr:hypothetical protein K501DRAFT_265667 [Backusella circina FSU 941]